MKKKRKKHPIFTIVVSKERVWICIAVIAAICVGWILSKCICRSESKTYTNLVKFSFSRTVHQQSGFFPFEMPDMLSYDFVLRQSSPIFFNSKNTVSAAPAKNDTESQSAPSPSTELSAQKKVGEKSIVSENLMMTNATSYQTNLKELSKAQRKYNATGDSPKVLIITTHGCETYSDENGLGLGEKNSYRTTDTEKNVTGIGEVITQELQSKGINVIHDKTMCDYPAYNESYMVSLKLIEQYLEKYPSIEFVFDIHRDAIESAEGVPTKLTCEINNEKCAQAMIVCGTDAMGLDHPNWKENLILASKIQEFLEDKYPGFMRPVNLREERFNTHKTTGSLIFEIGTHANTLDEARRSAVYLSEGIAHVLLS